MYNNIRASTLFNGPPRCDDLSLWCQITRALWLAHRPKPRVHHRFTRLLISPLCMLLSLNLTWRTSKFLGEAQILPWVHLWLLTMVPTSPLLDPAVTCAPPIAIPFASHTCLLQTINIVRAWARRWEVLQAPHVLADNLLSTRPHYKVLSTTPLHPRIPTQPLLTAIGERSPSGSSSLLMICALSRWTLGLKRPPMCEHPEVNQHFIRIEAAPQG